MMALSKVAAMSSLTEEETNFLRFANLLIRIAPKAVRDLFDKYFTPGTATVTVQSSDMDITLMICLLRNLKKMKIKDSLPAETDVCAEADISRIKYYRNWIAHNTDGHIDKHYFPAIWKNTCEAIQRLGGASLKTECDNLMYANLDSSYREVYVSFAQQEKRLDKVEEELMSAKDKIKQLEENQDNTKDNLLLQVAAWEQENEHCFATFAVKSIFESVKHAPFVVISGSPGMGKSATAYHIALLFRDMMGYEILPINEPSEILKFCKSGRKQIVIIDDICGKFAMNKHNVDSWVGLRKAITQLMSQTKDSLRIVATYRLHVRKTKQFEKLIQAFEIKECDLLSDELALNVDEKRKIGLCHLNEECLDMLEEAVIVETDMFPLLCKLSAEKTFNPDFFTKPYEIFEKELDEMALENKECFFGLTLIVLHNNNLKKSLFEEKHNKIFNDMFDEVYEELEMSDRPSKLLVLRSLQTLKGTLIKESECSVSAIHDKVFDFMAFFIGKMLWKTILKYGNSNFISERISFEFLVESTNDFVIMLDKNHEDLYFQRIEKEISCRKFNIVFSNVIAKTTYYQEHLIALLKKRCDTLSVLTGNLWPLVLSLELCGKLHNFLIDERLKRIHFEQTLDSESETDGSLTAVLNDTQIDVDDEELSSILTSSNGPLLLSIDEGREDLIILLLEAGNAININETVLIDDKEFSPLLYAFAYDQLDIAKILIDYKADVNLLYEGNALLHFVCEEGSTDFLEVLLSCEECDLNIANSHGMTALHIATAMGYTEIVELLILKDCDINVCDSNNQTPLCLAIQNYQKPCFELLISCGCDIDICNLDRQTSLHIACKTGHVDIVEIILNKNRCDIDKSDKNRNSPLAIACEHGSKDIVERLILKKCNINNVNLFGLSPLHIAVRSDDIEIVQTLIESGCDINLCDANKQTPLFFACDMGICSAVQLLLNKGCDVNICNSDGLTPLDIANAKGFLDIVSYFSKKDESSENELIYSRI
ncbi:unnamed protein product [Mytilus coruscus]|uniref:Uncharacterized protein n=1 Tax=Mytilus coruscus TaxID=42192 RepID=A0A6J8EUS9_MYTCO|nr:unnamed protein product [Mytilus coruscus]